MNWQPSLRLSVTALLMTLSLNFSGCAFRFEKEASPDGKPGDSAPSLTAAPSYESIKRLVLQPRCLSCHGSRAPILLTYDQVKANLPAIERTVLSRAVSPMPPAGPLPTDRAALLQKWINLGAPLESPTAGADTGSVTAPPVSGVLRPVTFARVKEEIFDVSCTSCHFPGNAEGNSDLTTYDGVKSEAGSVFAFAIIEQSMPPADEPGTVPLTQAQKDLLSLWFADGQQP